jgi:hypothetical protein
MTTRTDGLANLVTGMGLPSDPSGYSTLSARRYLTQWEQTYYHREFPILRKIVELFPDAAIAGWGKPVFGGNNADAELLQKLIQKLDTLKVVTEFHDLKGARSAFHWAQVQANLTGNAAAVLVVDDGESDLSIPLAIEKVREVLGLRLFDRWDLFPVSSTSRLKQFQYYQLNVGEAGASYIHRSRVLWFRGAIVSGFALRSHFYGCDDSVLVGAIDAFKSYQEGLQNLSRMLQNSGQRKHGISGLLDKLENDDGNYEKFLTKRLAIGHTQASNWNEQAYDLTEESIEFLERTNLSGVKDVQETLIANLTACSGLTRGQLLGEFSGGLLNATNEAEREQVNLSVLQKQTTQFSPNILRLCEIILASKEFGQGKQPQFSWEWNPYLASSPLEESDLQLNYMQIATNANQIDPRVAQAMLSSYYSGTKFNQNVTLDGGLVKAISREIKEASKSSEQNEESSQQVSAPFSPDEPQEELPAKTDSYTDRLPVPIAVQKTAKAAIAASRKSKARNIQAQIAFARILISGFVTQENISEMKKFFDGDRLSRKTLARQAQRELYGGDAGAAWINTMGEL